MARRQLRLRQRRIERMWWSKSRRPTVTPFKQGEPQTFVTLLCDSYRVDDAGLPALLDILREKRTAHPGMQLLATLDQLQQAFYTSGHSVDLHDLDDTEGYDLSGVDPGVFEDGEHPGHLATKSEFFIRHGNFQKRATVRFEDLAGKLFWKAAGDQPDFFAVNTKPDTILDKTIYVQVVPVARPCEALCAFPNGYFTDDLTPMENFAVAQRFEALYGYELFGVGATYIGFLKRRDLTIPEMRAFAEDILSLHRDAGDPSLAGRVAAVIGAQPFVLLNFNGS